MTVLKYPADVDAGTFINEFLSRAAAAPSITYAEVVVLPPS